MLVPRSTWWDSPWWGRGGGRWGGQVVNGRPGNGTAEVPSWGLDIWKLKELGEPKQSSNIYSSSSSAKRTWRAAWERGSLCYPKARTRYCSIFDGLCEGNMHNLSLSVIQIIVKYQFDKMCLQTAYLWYTVQRQKAKAWIMDLPATTSPLFQLWFI